MNFIFVMFSSLILISCSSTNVNQVSQVKKIQRKVANTPVNNTWEKELKRLQVSSVIKGDFEVTQLTGPDILGDDGPGSVEPGDAMFVRFFDRKTGVAYYAMADDEEGQTRNDENGNPIEEKPPGHQCFQTK